METTVSAVNIIASKKAQKEINPKAATLLLAATMFFTGAAGLINEYVLATVSTYVLGNSIEQFSMVIATMLLAMGIGSWCQRFVNDTRLVEKFIAIEVFLSIIGAFAPTMVYGGFAVVEDHFQLLQYSLIVGIGFLVGFEIPIVIRLNSRFSESLKINIATVYGLDYLGAFVAAVVWSQYLIKEIPLTEISFFLSGCNLVVAAMTYVYFVRCGWVEKPKVAGVAIVLAGLLMVYGFSQNRTWGEYFEQRMYADPIVDAVTTKYQRIVLTKNKKLGDVRLYLNGNLQLSSIDEARYHEMLIHPVMSNHQNPKRILVLGGGDGMAVRELLKYRSVEKVVLVDLDPAMIAFARDNQMLATLNGGAFSDARVTRLDVPLIEGRDRELSMNHATQGSDRRKRQRHSASDDIRYAKVTVVTMDADVFVRTVREFGEFDVIVSDLPDPNSIELAKLFSREFYRAIKSLLAPDGLLVVQSTSPFHAKEAFLCIGRTLSSAGMETLPYHDNIPSFGDWGWIIAWSENKRVTPPNLKNVDVPVPTKYVTTETIQAASAFGKGMLDSKRTDVNTRMHPVLLTLYSEGWVLD